MRTYNSTPIIPHCFSLSWFQTRRYPSKLKVGVYVIAWKGVVNDGAAWGAGMSLTRKQSQCPPAAKTREFYSPPCEQASRDANYANDHQLESGGASVKAELVNLRDEQRTFRYVMYRDPSPYTFPLFNKLRDRSGRLTSIGETPTCMARNCYTKLTLTRSFPKSQSKGSWTRPFSWSQTVP